MEGNFTWSGDLDPDELAERLSDLESAITSELESAADDIGVRIQSSAAMGAPVDEGRLRSSIERVVEKAGEYIVSVVVGSNVEYAPFQEFGTIFMSAQPFLRPALEENKSWIIERLETAVEDAFVSVGFRGVSL